jgi:thymidylate synthase
MENNIDKQYQALLQTILDYGVEKKDRTGTGTKSIFGYTIRHNMKDGFPALTTKKLAWKQVVSELLWFLTSQTNIQYLLKHNNHIWDGDAYKNYTTKLSKVHSKHYKPMEMKEFIERIKTDDAFANEYGELGPIYGKQWRKWDGKNGMIDQIDDLVKELKTNPDSRRLMVSAWNVGELDIMVLPPCHYGFQVWTREENGKRYISLMWNQRSVDTFLGLPFNIASYALLLQIIANEVSMIPDELIGNLGDTHLYLNHIEQAKEQIGRTSFDLPKLKTEAKIDGICCNVPDDFILEGYQYHPTIKAPLSN